MQGAYEPGTRPTRGAAHHVLWISSPYARSLAHTDTESSANGKNMRYTVALDAALLICKLEDQGSAVRFFGFFGPHR